MCHPCPGLPGSFTSPSQPFSLTFRKLVRHGRCTVIQRLPSSARAQIYIRAAPSAATRPAVQLGPCRRPRATRPARTTAATSRPVPPPAAASKAPPQGRQPPRARLRRRRRLRHRRVRPTAARARTRLTARLAGSAPRASACATRPSRDRTASSSTSSWRPGALRGTRRHARQAGVATSCGTRATRSGIFSSPNSSGTAASRLVGHQQPREPRRRGPARRAVHEGGGGSAVTVPPQSE